ncbi:MAG TPA: penicillin-binding protein [Bryobacteraceae bacterium]|jgi:cell division protein FtsI (penicillin-binding protein 3)|nr:penicillin-binding protein [Bryobacteraceae bacterium]
MESVDRNRAGKRLMWFGGVILVWGFLILVQLFRLQVVHHAEYVRAAQKQQVETVEIAAPRGSIFDRSGQLLAGSVKRDSVYIDPLQVPDLQVASALVSGVLHMDRAALYGRMQWYAANRKGFMWVARAIELEPYERLRSLHLDWIRFADESRRNYPRNTLAAHVIGAVDGEETGQWGLEKSLESSLRGAPGSVSVLTDAKGRGIDSHLETESRPGADLTLSIDERIQLPAQDAIAHAVQDSHAESGSVVVMDPYHGDILAIASYPPFDPNQPPGRSEGPTARFNHAVSVPFEPGSVFKVVTLSAALETTGLKPSTMINCGNGSFTMAGRTVHEAHHGYGTMPMEMVLAKSSNIGAIQIGLKVGSAKLYEYVRRFGLGARTGIPLPAESPGMVRKLSKWRTTSLMSVSMGHEVGVTTLQLARACSAVANGGLLVAPRLILKNGSEAVPMVPPHRILKPETAIAMRKMMEGVVLVGTGRRYANLQGYSSAGKTGSAQIFDYATGHYTHSYNASFMGFAPVANPAIVVVVTVNGTHGGSAGYGGPVAGPVFRAVTTEALRVLDVPKDLPDTAPDTRETQVADLDEVPIVDGPADPPVLEEAEARAPEVPQVSSPGPAPSAPNTVPAPPPPHQSGPKAPNFIGLSMRSAVALAQAQGLPVVLAGTGVVRAQVPPPGAVLHGGERIRVDLAR